MKKTNYYKNLASFSFEVGTLRKIIRAHRQTLLSDDLSDNIASHSFRVVIIAWFLAKISQADPYKTILMALFHDLPESRSGDQNWVNKKYIKVFEEEIIADQLQNLPGEEELLQSAKDYKTRQSQEAKLAKDADLIDQILLLKEYSHQGNLEAADWLGKTIKDNAQYQKLYSPTSKRLAKEIYSQRPGDWWLDLWTSERR